MRAGWAVVAGLALGVGVAWWLSRESPQAEHQKRARDAVPALYRWHDAKGVLQVTDKPPKGVHYERIGLRPRDGIEVRGDRP